MPSFSVDGPRVQRLLVRLEKSKEAYLRSDQYAYSRGYLEGMAHVQLIVREELDVNGAAVGPGHPDLLIPLKVVEAAIEHGVDLSDLVESLDCEHEMVSEMQPDGGDHVFCELCRVDADYLRAAGFAFNPRTQCLICGERGNGTLTDHEGDEIPCFECAVTD